MWFQEKKKTFILIAFNVIRQVAKKCFLQYQVISQGYHFENEKIYLNSWTTHSEILEQNIHPEIYLSGRFLSPIHFSMVQAKFLDKGMNFPRVMGDKSLVKIKTQVTWLSIDLVFCLTGVFFIFYTFIHIVFPSKNIQVLNH